MNPRIKTLLLHHREEPLRNVKAALERYSIDTVRATTCGEALSVLGRDNPPHVVLTDLTVSDSTWADALLLPTKSPVPVNLVVVSDVADLSLWRTAMECGAFKYITLPLPDSELRSLVQRAAENIAQRRGTALRLAKTA